MGLADLHIHTICSPDGTGTVRAVLKRAAEVGLDVIAITDHDEIRAALEGADLAPSYGLHVIPGVEVSTADGHLLALFVHRRPPVGLSASDTVRWVRDEGGLCIAPHPGQGRQSLSFQVLQQVLKDPQIAPSLVGMEVFNASAVHQKRNHIAMATVREMGWSLALIGNSDAHMVRMIGSATTCFPGHTPEELWKALISRNTEVAVAESLSRSALFLRWGAHLALRYIGWVTVNHHPDAPLRKAWIGLAALHTSRVARETSHGYPLGPKIPPAQFLG
ncbi:MAG: PHP domain-containing protein [Anaerolineae bacterium]|nr:PHP domain-containing protein [Anaerolineae bacterium]MDW8101072.1 PHP domain-containing protein [Anaerolineae bacterium]